MILHSQRFGEGSPLVILHGFLGMSDNWKTLGRKFGELGFEVHLVDQRNHGRSFHDKAFNYGLMAEDLKNYCDHYQLDEIALLGHSMGGKTAMQFASVNSEAVSRLVVADIAPKAYPPHHQDILKGLNALDFSEIRSRGQADEALAVYVKEAGVRQFLLKNLYWVEKGQLGLRINLPTLTEKYDAVGEALAEPSVYDRPTLFVRGDRSGYIQDIDEISIKRHFPDARLATVRNAGHWLHADNPSDFLEIIVKFLLNKV